MTYDPFVRGEFAVGVRTERTVDSRRARELTFEVWYPAAGRFSGLDLDPSTQDRYALLPGTEPRRQAAVRDAPAGERQYPVVLYSHTSYGHRRQATYLCTHVASHGYVVVAPDHAGNTWADLVARASIAEPRSPAEREAYVRQIIADRVPDLRLVMDRVLEGSVGALSDLVDDRAGGLIGWSFGGWAALATPEVDDRFGALVALTPGGSSNPLPGIIPATLTFDWRSDVSTLYLAAGRDRYTPVPGIRELYERTPFTKRLVILPQAEHDSFGDHVEVELVPRQQSQLFARGLALAQLDAALKGNAGAATLLDDAASTLRDLGVAVTAEAKRSHR